MSLRSASGASGRQSIRHRRACARTVPAPRSARRGCAGAAVRGREVRAVPPARDWARRRVQLDRDVRHSVTAGKTCRNCCTGDGPVDLECRAGDNSRAHWARCCYYELTEKDQGLEGHLTSAGLTYSYLRSRLAGQGGRGTDAAAFRVQVARGRALAAEEGV